MGIGKLVPPDTLVPGAPISESTSEAEYAAILKDAFPALYTRDVRARLIFTNPFAGGLGNGGEGGLAIVLRGAAYFVVGASSKRWLWQYTPTGKDQAKQFKIKLLPGGYHKVPIARCSRSLETQFGEELVYLWRQVVAQASYHHFDRLPMDAVEVEFAAMTDRGMLAGSTYASFSGAKVRNLIDTAFALDDYCVTGKRAAFDHVKQAANELGAALLDRH